MRGADRHSSAGTSVASHRLDDRQRTVGRNKLHLGKAGDRKECAMLVFRSLLAPRGPHQHHQVNELVEGCRVPGWYNRLDEKQARHTIHRHAAVL